MFMVTTENIQGYTVTQSLGVVKGSSVRAKWFGADFLAGLKNIVGGEMSEYVKLMDEARESAIQRMCSDAEKLGANAIINIRFTTSQIAQGAAEILVFGTAAKITQTG